MRSNYTSRLNLDEKNINSENVNKTFKELLNLYWKNIDPFDSAGQFCDKGLSYRSVIFYENENEGRNGIFNCLNFLSTLNEENPNSMIMQFFFQGKTVHCLCAYSG